MSACPTLVQHTAHRRLWLRWAGMMPPARRPQFWLPLSRPPQCPKRQRRVGAHVAAATSCWVSVSLPATHEVAELTDTELADLLDYSRTSRLKQW